MMGSMTAIDVEIEALRLRRRSPGFTAWVRQFRPFDRRAIREPDERDAYWARVQARLAVSDHESLSRDRNTGRPERPTLLIG